MSKKSQNSIVSIQELEASWKDLAVDEITRAETMLLQASNYLRLVALNNGKDIDDMIARDQSGVYGANVKTIICNAVERALSLPTDMAPDATAWSQSASPYSESMNFSGDTSKSIFFKSRELKLIGLNSISGRKQIGIIRGIR